MMRTGLNAIGAHSETSAMIGDRMDTDVLAGLEAGMETFLVLTGLTRPTRSSATRSGRPRSWTRSRTSSTWCDRRPGRMTWAGSAARPDDLGGRRRVSGVGWGG